jgi:hypothetical protein
MLFLAGVINSYEGTLSRLRYDFIYVILILLKQPKALPKS